jgi:hypothetical protein
VDELCVPGLLTVKDVLRGERAEAEEIGASLFLGNNLVDFA